MIENEFLSMSFYTVLRPQELNQFNLFIILEIRTLFQNRGTTPSVSLTLHFWSTIPNCAPSLPHSINTIQYNTIRYNTIQYNKISCITYTVYPVWYLDLPSKFLHNSFYSFLRFRFLNKQYNVMLQNKTKNNIT